MTPFHTLSITVECIYPLKHGIITGFNKNKMNKLIKRVNRNITSNENYIRLHLTFTSRVIAGWAITLVGLVKLWTTSDPTAWLPVVLGGTGMMIVSRGVDHYYMNNQQELNERQVDLRREMVQAPYQHANLNDNVNFDEMDESYAVSKHKEYQNRLPV